jgi:formylglycine-generating enzyme required for sulfatase activity
MVRRFSGLFWPNFERKLILSPKKESKFGSKEPKNRQNLNYARGLLNNMGQRRMVVKKPKCLSMKSIGDYEIVKEIGEGSLGRVYLAEHRFLRRSYALKVLPEELSSEKTFVERFGTEVSILAALDHAHIVKMHQVSCFENYYYLVSDCIVDDMGETTNLAQYLSSQDGFLAEEELVKIAQQIGSALDYAHQKAEPLIHRGIKLNNILVSRKKEGIHVYLSDFGLSKILGEGIVLSRTYKAVADCLGVQVPSGKYPTSPYDHGKISKLHQSFIQNFAFLSPEQKMMGENCDVKSDIYAFGVLIYYLMFRRFPEGFFDLPSTAGTPYQLNWDSLLRSCLQADPKKRPTELKGVLEGLLGGTGQPEDLKPLLKPQEIVRPEFEADPGAIFQIETQVGLYQPVVKEHVRIEPLLTEMKVVRGGSFLRGSNQGARDGSPRHTITLRSFAIDIHPVTNEQFVRFLEEMGGEKDGNNNDMIRLRESRIKRMGGRLSIESGYAKHPVVGVTWYGGVAYSKWVGKRLPLEAEWEVAASCGIEEHIYPTGQTIERTQANFFSSDTTPVMSYSPNDWGIYDMAGNVYEWCQDWYDYHYYSVSIQEPNNPRGPLQGVYRVLRGGCWKSLKEDLSCSHRHRNNPGTMNGTYGFRCAADVL